MASAKQRHPSAEPMNSAFAAGAGHSAAGEVMEQVQQGGSIRRLQGLGAMIVNCARSPDGSKVPPTREHVLEALEEVRKTEAQTEKAAATRAAAQSGVVGSRVGYE